MLKYTYSKCAKKRKDDTLRGGNRKESRFVGDKTLLQRIFLVDISVREGEPVMEEIARSTALVCSSRACMVQPLITFEIFIRDAMWQDYIGVSMYIGKFNTFRKLFQQRRLVKNAITTIQE